MLKLIEQFKKDAKKFNRNINSIDEFVAWNSARVEASKKKAEEESGKPEVVTRKSVLERLNEQLSYYYSEEPQQAIDELVKIHMYGYKGTPYNKMDDKELVKEMASITGEKIIIKGTKKKADKYSIKLIVSGGGDPSVGIPDVEARIDLSIEDNLVDVDTIELEKWLKEFFAEYYDVKKNVVFTEEELRKLEEEEKEFVEQSEKFESSTKTIEGSKKRAFKIESLPFSDLASFGEGLVVLGAGEPHDEWINGIANVLKEEEIVESNNPDDLFSNIVIVSDNVEGAEGRTDLVMVFKDDAKLDMGKMAMWRISFGDISWLSDFRDNYSEDYLSGKKRKKRR